MNKSLPGFVVGVVVGFSIGWLLEPEEKEARSQYQESIADNNVKLLNDGRSTRGNAEADYLRKIAELESQVERFDPIRENLEMQYRDFVASVRKSHDELLRKIDTIAFLEPQQIERLNENLEIREKHRIISFRSSIGLMPKKEAEELLAAIPRTVFSRESLLNILNEEQRLLFEEAEYLERRERERSGATSAVERLTRNIDITEDQELQLIEQRLDIHTGPSDDIAQYIAPEFADLQIGDIVKAEISQASKVLSESQLIEYIETHLKRY